MGDYVGPEAGVIGEVGGIEGLSGFGLKVGVRFWWLCGKGEGFCDGPMENCRKAVQCFGVSCSSGDGEDWVVGPERDEERSRK